MKYPLVLKAYNLYHLLGLENYASGEQIKKRYWQLARKYHPDRVESTEEETQRFVLSTAAYNFLRDDKKRHSYELLLKRKQEKKMRFMSSELVCQRQQTHKCFYSARMTVDHDFNRFMDEMNTQVVTTLEGNAATIYFTRRIPLKETRSFSTGNKVTQLESIRFRDVRSRFMVLPQIRGDQVILEISPQQSRITNGEIETVGLNTIVRGRIGEWIELGGLNQNRNEQSSGIASRNTSGQVEKRSVFIKVEKQ